MLLIKYMAIKKLTDGSERYIIINSLNAFSGIINEIEKKTIEKWQQEKSINVENDQEKVLFCSLKSNGFIVNCKSDEDIEVERISEECRKTHELLAKKRKKVVFALTYACNFDCPYCYEKSNCPDQKRVMTKSQIDRVLEINKGNILSIDLFGGEPLLPSTMEIIEYLFSKAPNEEYIVTTNGYYLEDFIPLLKTVNVHHVMVTLDGRKERHNKSRILKNREGTYDKIIQGVEKCLKNEIPIRIRMNLTMDNGEECILLREELKEIYSKAYNNGILSFELQPVFQMGRQHRRELFYKSLYKLPEGEKRIISNNTLYYSSYPLLRKIVNPKYVFSPKYCNCDAEENRQIYDPYGDVYSCIISLGNKDAVSGTYYPKITENKNSICFRNIESVPTCSRCIYRFICGGGCANENLSKGKTVMDPNCSYMNEQINLLELIVRKKLEENV